VRGVGVDALHLAAQRDQQDQRDRDQRERAAEEGAGHVQPDSDQDQGEDDSR
jgi:hypothetical protein